MTNETCVNGANLARRCDVVFAEVASPDVGRQLTFRHKLVKLTDDFYIYHRKDFDIRDGDTVFCKVDFIGRLFRVLRWRRNLKDIKLVTAEGARPSITRRIFQKRPRCIVKWYATNVDHDDPDLVPLPLGIGNYYSIGTMTVEDLTARPVVPAGEKKLLYVNHRVETNPHVRAWAYARWQTNDWRTVDAPDLTPEQYMAQLDRHEFLLAPWGVGIDTHRLWEALYHGIIPVTDRHTTYRATEGLPVLLVDSMEREIDRDFLLEKLETFRNRTWRYEKLNVDWWYERIKAGASI